MSGDADHADSDAHVVEGTWHETVVECPETGEEYGPGADEPDRPRRCPYCGEDASDGAHRVSEYYGEVFCDYTTMSTWRYCPGCSKTAGAIQ